MFMPMMVFLMVGAVILGFIETIFLMRERGPMRRGFRIWREPISRETANLLRNIDEEGPIEDWLQTWTRRVKIGLIRRKKNEIYIRVFARMWSTRG